MVPPPPGLPGGQGIAGSNPVVPTRFQLVGKGVTRKGGALSSFWVINCVSMAPVTSG